MLDEEYRFVREIAGFTNEGKEETFSSPQGLFVASNGSLYICDTENSRIVYLDAQGEPGADLYLPRNSRSEGRVRLQAAEKSPWMTRVRSMLSIRMSIPA